MDLVTFATRVCKLLGVETMIGALALLNNCQVNGLTLYIVTNAAGGLNENYEVGDIVCLNDVRQSFLDTSNCWLMQTAPEHGRPCRHSPFTRAEHRRIWRSVPATVRCIRS
jgi:nucleoside phosphorylase